MEMASPSSLPFLTAFQNLRPSWRQGMHKYPPLPATWLKVAAAAALVAANVMVLDARLLGQEEGRARRNKKGRIK